MLAFYLLECSAFAPPAWHGAGILGVERISRCRGSLDSVVSAVLFLLHLPLRSSYGDGEDDCALTADGERNARKSIPRLTMGQLCQVGPGEFEWEGNLEARPAESPILPGKKLLSKPAFPSDAPPSTTNTITTWSESEGSEAWARESPSLMCLRVFHAELAPYHTFLPCPLDILHW